MNSVYRDIFIAIHEGKWLSIAYHNKNDKITRYWIGIRDLNPVKRTMAVDGLHLGKFTTDSYSQIYIDSIQSSKVIEGSYCPVNQKLVEDISLNPHKYSSIFDQVINLKILNYLEMCNRMDTVPYYSEFELVHYLDRESFREGAYPLDPEQFQFIVKQFQYNESCKTKKDGRIRMQQLAMNVISLHTEKGLYVLAYRRLNLDVKQRVLRPGDELIICTEFTFEGVKESIRQYLDADDYELLQNFEKNQEKIKDCLTEKNKHIFSVDDMPYVIGLGMDIAVDLHSEYEAIIQMFRKGIATVPLKAFFGDLLNRPVRRKAYPIIVIDNRVNLDQLLAINNAIKFPVSYIQGPPGTGKTSTIINTIITAFFNEKTVLFTSYNNHPIDGVFEKLSGMKYKKYTIPFPALRLGNFEKIKEALNYMRNLYQNVRDTKVYTATLDRNKDDRTERAKRLANLLRAYEELLDLQDRKDALERVLGFTKQDSVSPEIFYFHADIKGRQLEQVRQQIEKIGTITNEEACRLLDDDSEELRKYLYYTSARYIKRLDEPKNSDLKEIINEPDEEKRYLLFVKYLSKTENIKKLQRIFPIILTTCTSAQKIGKPEAMFHMTIMDEASQCNTAVSLVPVIRGESLMLVGDPQQLNPVILLDEMTNEKLKRKYGISDDYDYRKNSVYKTYLACDAVSDEILLHYHYRCHKKIIQFNNQKYYHSKLNIASSSEEQRPLIYLDIPDSKCDYKNTAPAEAQQIVRYAAFHKDKQIGVITPFVNQKKLIESEIKRAGLKNVVCGTVHAFQGDEKDVILFSTAITEQTKAGTYKWLKNNRELINVATSRAKERLVVLSNEKNLERLHKKDGNDDLYELIQYVKNNGHYEVTQKQSNSRALGIKPFSTATEEAFLQNLQHAMENIWLSQNRYTVHKEVAISQVFQNNDTYSDLFYTGRFDFVVYEKQGKKEIPVLAIELDGKEHYEDQVVRQRDRKKEQICKAHNLQLIRVENSYARRYNYIKDILISYFSVQR